MFNKVSITKLYYEIAKTYVNTYNIYNYTQFKLDIFNSTYSNYLDSSIKNPTTKGFILLFSYLNNFNSKLILPKMPTILLIKKILLAKVYIFI